LEPLSKAFNERLQEIEAYLELLAALEREIRDGLPKIGDSSITVQQQRILYASVYLQLYNLVEATATWCIEGVVMASSKDEQWRPGDLSAEMRREWVKWKARTHSELNSENRLNQAVRFFDWLVESRPIKEWTLEGKSGNWDDSELESIAIRMGFRLEVTGSVYSDIKKKIRDDKAPLVLVKLLRNKLAHGALSFTECGENVTVAELRELKDRAARYLREVIELFQRFIDGYNFLVPARRPGGSALL